MTLADILSAIDSAKRRGYGLLSDAAQNPGTTLADLAKGMGRSAAELPVMMGQGVGNLITGGLLGDAPMDQLHGLIGENSSDAQAVGGLLGPPVKTGATLAGLAASKAPALAALMFHGSPHLFDKFSLSKIGTGEGAQAYGHGLYFADNPAVATQYAENVKDMGAVKDINAQLSKLADVMHRDEVPGSYRKYRTAEGEAAAQQYDALMQQRHEGLQKPGNLYKVDVPDEAVANMLHWDKPLSEQPETHAALAKLGQRTDLPAGFGKALQAAIGRPHFDGQDLYTELMNVYKDAPTVASAMKESGLPGIRYLDQGSRAAGGTYNTVLFDDELAKILSRE